MKFPLRKYNTRQSSKFFLLKISCCLEISSWWETKQLYVECLSHMTHIRIRHCFLSVKKANNFLVFFFLCHVHHWAAILSNGEGKTISSKNTKVFILAVQNILMTPNLMYIQRLMHMWVTTPDPLTLVVPHQTNPYPVSCSGVRSCQQQLLDNSNMLILNSIHQSCEPLLHKKYTKISKHVFKSQ